MSLPFQRDPEPATRQADTDPFLEFEPERPGVFKTPLPAPKTQVPPSAPSPAVMVQVRRRSGVGAAVVLVLLVATAVVTAAWMVGDRDQVRQILTSVRGAVAGITAGGGAADASPDSRDPAEPVTNATLAPLAGPSPSTAAAPPPTPVSRPAPSILPATPPIAAPSTAPGFVTFRAPLDLEIFHQGRLIGSTGAGRVALPPGVADIVLVSARHEFRQSRSVTVTSGQSTAVSVSLPSGQLSVNAEPWAEVLIDRRSVGITPLANLPFRIGSHEVVWRHPTLGERRQVVIVRARTPTRVGIDFRR